MCMLYRSIQMKNKQMTEIRTAGAWEVGVVFKGRSNFTGGWKAWCPFFRTLSLFDCAWS